MIVLRQKQYSTKTTQALYKFKAAGNAIKSGVFKGAGKSKTQLAREAINMRESLRPSNIKGKVIGAALNTSRKIEEAIYRPGHVASKGIELVAKNPAAAITYVATAPLPVPSAVVSGAVNKIANKVPAYTRATTRLGEAWKKSKMANRLSGITGYDVSRAVQMIPIV
jgi:hypothetical protein